MDHLQGIYRSPACGIINGWNIPFNGAQRIGILYRSTCRNAFGSPRSEVRHLSIAFAGDYISIQPNTWHAALFLHCQYIASNRVLCPSLWPTMNPNPTHSNQKTSQWKPIPLKCHREKLRHRYAPQSNAPTKCGLKYSAHRLPPCKHQLTCWLRRNKENKQRYPYPLVWKNVPREWLREI